MLIELALRGRLQLEACGMRRKSLLTRKVSGEKWPHSLLCHAPGNTAAINYNWLQEKKKVLYVGIGIPRS